MSSETFAFFLPYGSSSSCRIPTSFASCKLCSDEIEVIGMIAAKKSLFKEFIAYHFHLVYSMTTSKRNLPMFCIFTSNISGTCARFYTSMSKKVLQKDTVSQTTIPTSLATQFIFALLQNNYHTTQTHQNLRTATHETHVWSVVIVISVNLFIESILIRAAKKKREIAVCVGLFPLIFASAVVSWITELFTRAPAISTNLPCLVSECSIRCDEERYGTRAVHLLIVLTFQ